MKIYSLRTTFIIGLLVLAGMQADAQAPLAKPELAKIQAVVANQTPVSYEAVTLDFTGTWDDVKTQFTTFLNNFNNQKLDTKLSSPPTAILLVYEDPAGKATWRMGVGFEVPVNIAPAAPLRAQKISHAAAVRHTHTGPYGDLKNVHSEIASRLGKAPMWPVTIRYFDDPSKVAPGNLRNEIIVPTQ